MPNTELISWSRLTIPSPIVTGSISMNTCLMRGSCQSIVICRRKSIRAERPERHQHLHERGHQHARSQTRRLVAFFKAPWKCGRSTTSSTMITTFHTAGEIAGIVKWS